MRKSTFVLPLAALVAVAMTACTDTAGPNGLTPDVLFSHTEGHDGRHNGPVWVQLVFDLEGNGGTPAGVNQHPQGKGTCRDELGVQGSTTDHTIWYNEQGKKTNSKFCEGSEGDGASGSCTAFGEDTPQGIPATYAAAGNDPGDGNENLNFYTDDEDVPEDRFIHYKDNSTETDAKGVVDFVFTCGEDATEYEGSLALSQFETYVSGVNNAFIPGEEVDEWQLDLARDAGMDPVVVTTDSGEGTVTAIFWVFRSRAGS
jgi:hypothetical protein